jgi:hypothetical protein
VHPADRFILLGAVEDPAAPRALAQLATSGPDWWGLLATMQYNRCLMYIEQQLLDSPVVPAEIKAAVMLQAETVRADDRRLRRRFEAMLPVILRHGPVVLLRGVANAYTMYREVARRPIGSDVDLLIDKPPLPSFSGWLQDHWAIPEEVQELFPPRIELHRDLNVKSSWGVRVGAMDMRAMWERRRPIVVAGHEVGVLAPEDGLIYVAQHNALKGLVRLYRFVDLVDWITYEALHWEEVIERSREYRVAPAVWINLRIVNQLRPGTVPDEVVRRLEPGTLRRRFVERMFKLESVLHDPTPLPDDWVGYRGAKGAATPGSPGAPRASRRMRRIRKGLLLRMLVTRPGNAHRVLLGPLFDASFKAYSRVARWPMVSGWVGGVRTRVQRR